MQLVISQRVFDRFSSLFKPFLNKVVILLHPTGDDWANCIMAAAYVDAAAMTAVSSVTTLESRERRRPPSSLNGFPVSSKETTRAWTFLLKAFFSTGLCSWCSMQSVLLTAMLCSNLLSKQAICGPAVIHTLKAPGKSYCTSISFHHCIVLLMCLVKGYGWERTTRFLHNKSTIAKGLIHWWVPPSELSHVTDNKLVKGEKHGNSLECSAPTPAYISNMQTVFWTSLQMSHCCPPCSQMLCDAVCRVQQQWNFMPR